MSATITWRWFLPDPAGCQGASPHDADGADHSLRQDAAAGLNEALWAKAAGQKLLRTARVRADAMVIAANVAYPTDSGLLAKAVGNSGISRSETQGECGPGGTGVSMRCSDKIRAARSARPPGGEPPGHPAAPAPALRCLPAKCRPLPATGAGLDGATSIWIRRRDLGDSRRWPPSSCQPPQLPVRRSSLRQIRALAMTSARHIINAGVCSLAG